MKIIFLTPGTGSYYCGACMRDNALAKAVHAAGHEVSLLPMYLPLQLDEEPLAGNPPAPMFFGGINVWLQQKSSLFRHTPEWFDRLLDHPALLRKVARHSHMTAAADHGEMTLAMLRVEESRLRKELERLTRWLVTEQPDVLCLSTALQAGMIRELRRHLDARVICQFQGEDTFLDSLPPPWRDACWHELAVRVREADTLVAPSESYAALMRERLGPGDLPVAVIPNGIELDGFVPSPAPAIPPVIGFLARMTREKGLDLTVDAFIRLRTKLGHPDARLHLAGAATPGDQGLLATLRQRLAAAGLTDSVTWSPNLSRAAKTEMLRSLTLFSVPAIYQEAFGLYVIEALASGVPVVQPDAASFPEIIRASGGGLLVRPNDPDALAQGWFELLDDPAARARMAKDGRRSAETLFSVAAMRDRFLNLLR